jgi:hypothetical protein
VVIDYFILFYCIYFGLTQIYHEIFRSSGFCESKLELFLLGLRLHGISLPLDKNKIRGRPTTRDIFGFIPVANA